MDLQHRLNAELDHACLSGEEQSVARLIHVGADPIHDNGNALLAAVARCKYPVVEHLLKCDAYKDPSAAKACIVKAYKHFKERKFDDDDKRFEHYDIMALLKQHYRLHFNANLDEDVREPAQNKATTSDNNYIDTDLRSAIVALKRLHKSTGLGMFRNQAEGLTSWAEMLDDAKRKEWGIQDLSALSQTKSK